MAAQRMKPQILFKWERFWLVTESIIPLLTQFKETKLTNVKVKYHADVDSGDVNMEASISADDVMRAGGYGARDDISSFLPVASDSTDFEASLRDARDYEEPQKDVCRPGLGWKNVKDQEKP